MREQRYHGLWIGLFALLGVALAAMWKRRSFQVEVYGSSMSPTLEPREYLLALRTRTVRLGSLVVVEHPNQAGHEMVKRIEAGPGGQVGDRILGADEYWVVGDNSDRSTDSRSFGPVRREAIRGRVILRYWPIRRTVWFA